MGLKRTVDSRCSGEVAAKAEHDGLRVVGGESDRSAMPGYLFEVHSSKIMQ